MRNFWNWAREVNWLAVVAMVLLVAALAVAVWAVLTLLEAVAALGVVFALAGVGLAILSR